MKNNLGNVIIICLSLIALHAEDFTYTFKVNNQTPYVKEALILTLDLNQTRHDRVLLFNFKIKQSDDYRFQRLDIKETDTGHHAQVHYVYLIYPLSSGKIHIRFELIKKVTTEDSVTYSFSGDRDNVKGLVTVDTVVTLEPLLLQVKPLAPETLLVGDFNLTYTIPKHQAKTYEPLPFQVTFQGVGYPPLLKSILPKEGNFTRFTEQPIVKSIAGVQGFQNKVTYPMALSHSKSFTLAPIVIKAFNPKIEESYTLTIPAQNFDITQQKVTDLIDTVDAPKAWKEDWSWIKTFLGYLVVFGAGYLSALSWKWRKKSIKHVENPLVSKIQNAKDGKALLQLLMSIDSQQFNTSIDTLETSLYGEGKINLKTVKEEILEKII